MKIHEIGNRVQPLSAKKVTEHDAMCAEKAREGLDLIVVDEVASFRNNATDRWKALNALVNGSKKGRHAGL